MELNKLFWKNKVVFITGHNGFIGTWMCLVLLNLGVAKIYGYSLNNKKAQNFYRINKFNKKIISINGDINNFSKLNKSIQESKAHIVFHLAAQPIVSLGYSDPLCTFKTNIIGTLNLMQSLRSTKKIKSAVIVTSDKCYKNKEWVWGYRETDSLGGHDPYSASKAGAEIITESMRLSFFNDKDNQIGIATARAGNIIGGGDWSEKRIIPDIALSLFKNKDIVIRNPNAVRPWQHVFDAINGYLILAEKLTIKNNKYSGAWNFGPKETNITVKNIVDKSIKIWNSKIKWIQDKKYSPHETTTLKLDISKSQKFLEWDSKIKVDEALKLTFDWYKIYYSKKNIAQFTKSQVESFF